MDDVSQLVSCLSCRSLDRRIGVLVVERGSTTLHHRPLLLLW